MNYIVYAVDGYDNNYVLGKYATEKEAQEKVEEEFNTIQDNKWVFINWLKVELNAK